MEQGEDVVGDAAGIDMVHEGVDLGGVSPTSPSITKGASPAVAPIPWTAEGLSMEGLWPLRRLLICVYGVFGLALLDSLSSAFEGSAGDLRAGET